MKYLCLICAARMTEQLSAHDAERHHQDYAAFTQELRRSGRE